MAKINKSAIRKKALRGLKSKGAEKKIYRKVNAAFQRKREELMRNFDEHPITQEIKAGPEASNSSRTIVGGYGNLFTFIGFNTGADPTAEVRAALRYGTRLIRTPRKRGTKRGVLYSYDIVYTNLNDLRGVSPMPWEPGSWVQKVERGISGLGYYIYHKYVVPGSRSGKGTQSTNKLRGGVYKRTRYMSAILKTFKSGWKI
jgi:hypothetical protein